MKKFCSIIIPFKNSKKTLRKCISSVINQVGKVDYEIILINDFSNDGSNLLCQKLIKDINKCRLLKSKKNTIGPGHARNIGIKNAKGRYIFFLDSDDYLKKNALILLLKEFEKSNYPDLICINFKLFDKVGNIKKKNRFDLELYKETKKKILLNFFNLSIIPQVISNLISKSVIDKNRIQFVEGYFEDINFFFKVLYYVKNIKILKQAIYFKINNHNSIVNSLTKQHIIDSFNAYYLSYKFLIKKNFLRKKIINEYLMIALSGQVAVFLKRIYAHKANVKKANDLGNLLKKSYFKIQRKLKFNYIFTTNKDIIAKKFLYDKE